MASLDYSASGGPQRIQRYAVRAYDRSFSIDGLKPIRAGSKPGAAHLTPPDISQGSAYIHSSRHQLLPINWRHTGYDVHQLKTLEGFRICRTGRTRTKRRQKLRATHLEQGGRTVQLPE